MRITFTVCLAIGMILQTAQLTAQPSVARNFDRNDCNGAHHNLFTQLDSGDVVVMEFVMTCSSCVNAEHKVETMLQWLVQKYPNRIRFYQFAYTDSYTCATMQSFLTTNEMHTVPFDSGASDVAYYGGFGMPTFAIVAGKSHNVLFSAVGFSTTDTTDMSTALQAFFLTADVTSGDLAPSITLYPNPTHNNLVISNLSALSGPWTYILVNEMGQRVCDWKSLQSGTDQAIINLQDLNISAGSYVLQIRNSEQLFTRSFVLTK